MKGETAERLNSSWVHYRSEAFQKAVTSKACCMIKIPLGHKNSKRLNALTAIASNCVMQGTI